MNPEQKRYTAADIHIVSFVEAVCRRPRMYTLNGSLAEVICFLTGFYSGMVTHRRYAPALRRVEREWHGFITWVVARLKLRATHDWADVAAALHQRGLDDAAALNYLADLNSEYRAHLPEPERSNDRQHTS